MDMCVKCNEINWTREYCKNLSTQYYNCNNDNNNIVPCGIPQFVSRYSLNVSSIRTSTSRVAQFFNCFSASSVSTEFGTRDTTLIRTLFRLWFNSRFSLTVEVFGRVFICVRVAFVITKKQWRSWNFINQTRW